MSHKILLGAALVAVAVLGFAWFDVNNQSIVTQTPTDTTTSVTVSPGTTTGTPGTTPTPTPVPTPTSYTLAQVATHSSAASCWAAINGKVYNLTSWIRQHPGGQTAILSLCGTDGSAAFNGQHGGQARPASELAGFFLAPLAQ